MMLILTVLLAFVGSEATRAEGAVTISTEQSKICQSYLGSPATAALTSAVASGGYGFEVLTADINGRSRTVLLLGEHHWKSQEEGEAGKSLIKHFDSIATEGAAINKLWGGRLINWLVKLVDARSKDLNLSHSTIDDVRAAELTQRLKVGMAEGFIEAGLGVDTVIKLGDIDLKNGIRISAVEIIELIQAIETKKVPSGTRRYFDLEVGHRITLRENIGSILLPVEVAAPSIACGLSACYLGYAALSAPDQFTLAGVLTAASYLAFRATRSKGSWLTGKLLGKPRDPTMAKNISEIFANHSDIDKLLVIVGNGHVNGVANFLNQRGFNSAASARMPVN